MSFFFHLAPISSANSYLEGLYNRIFGPKNVNEENELDLEVQSKTRDLTSALPDELMLHIFSYLALSSLGTSLQVCRRWNRIAGDDSLWKSVIYREIAFSTRDWARYFRPVTLEVEEVVAYEDCREEFDSLPWKEYIEDSKKIHKLFPKKSGKDSLMLVRLPKTLTATRNEEGVLVGGLTINRLGQLARIYFPQNVNGYRLIQEDIVNELGDRPVGDRSYWVLMTTDIFLGSRNKNYAVMTEIVASLSKQSLTDLGYPQGPGLKDYEIPKTLEAATCILSQYFKPKIHLFSTNPPTYTLCKEEIQGAHTAVGYFSHEGLVIKTQNLEGWSNGVAAVRRF